MSPQFGGPGAVELIQTVPSNPERRDSDQELAAGDLERSSGPVRRLAAGRSSALTRSQPKRGQSQTRVKNSSGGKTGAHEEALQVGAAAFRIGDGLDQAPAGI